MYFDIDKLYNNRKALVTINFPTTGSVLFGGATPQPIYGLVETDFAFNVDSSFSDVDPGSTNFAQAGLNMAQAATGGTNRVVNNVVQTLQRWNGHTSPIFSFPITIIKYKDSIDILGQVSTLMSAPAGTYDGLTLRAPYEYGFNGISNIVSSALGDLGINAKEVITQTPSGSLTYANIGSFVNGTWSIQYSDWFYASNLILHGCHLIAMSKQIIQGTNEPLYAKLAVSFQTAFLPDATTIKGWFIPKNADSGTGSNISSIIANLGNTTGAPLQ